MIDDLPAGVYQHYKGPLYLVMGLAHDANAESFFTSDEEKWFPTGERTVVLYVGLELTDAHKGARLAVRTYNDFFAYVCGNGDCEFFGHEKTAASLTCPSCGCSMRQRFEYVGPTWEGEH